MGIAAGIAAAASAASLASSVSGLVGGGGGGGTGGYYSGGGSSGGPPVYIPQNQPGADALYYQIAQQMAGPSQIGLPQGFQQDYLSYLGGIQSNPFVGGNIAGAQAGGAYGTNTLAPMQQGGAASLYGAGNQIIGTAFDPQRNLYNYLQQQTTDQSNATNAMYGLGSSPYGAGVADQNLNKFNIDWQNAQLERQLQGVQGAGKAFAGASELGGSAINTLATSGALPYSTYNNYYSDLTNAANAANSGVTNAYGLDQNTLNALAAYLRLGQSATGIGQAGQQAGFNQQQVLGQNLATSLTNPALTNLFNGVSNFFTPTDVSYGTNYGAGVPNYGAYGAAGPTIDPNTGALLGAF